MPAQSCATVPVGSASSWAAITAPASIVPTNAPYAAPISWPPNLRAFARYAPMLAYHDPQMKYWRNMNAESWTLSRACIGPPVAGCGGQPVRPPETGRIPDCRGRRHD